MFKNLLKHRECAKNGSNFLTFNHLELKLVGWTLFTLLHLQGCKIFSSYDKTKASINAFILLKRTQRYHTLNLSIFLGF